MAFELLPADAAAARNLRGLLALGRWHRPGLSAVALWGCTQVPEPRVRSTAGTIAARADCSRLHRVLHALFRASTVLKMWESFYLSHMIVHVL